MNLPCQKAHSAALPAGHLEMAVVSSLPRPERAGPCWASPGLLSLWPQQAGSGGCGLSARVRGRRALSAGAGGYLRLNLWVHKGAWSTVLLR